MNSLLKIKIDYPKIRNKIYLKPVLAFNSLYLHVELLNPYYKKVLLLIFWSNEISRFFYCQVKKIDLELSNSLAF